MKYTPFFLYGLFLAIFSCFTYLFIDPGFFYLGNISTGFAFSEREYVSLFYVISILFLFSFYGFFLFQIKRKKLHLKDFYFLLGLSLVLFIFSYPTILSYDIFNYMATAKVTFFYRENPYIVMPIEFINDMLLSYTRAANKTALYGPAWILLSGVPFTLSFGNVLIQVFLFKFLTGIFYILMVFLLYRLTKNFFMVVLFSLNPLVLIEVLVSGHNDVVMMAFALFSFYFLQKKNIFWAFVFIFLSIFIKYATIFLLPVFIFVLWKVSVRKEVSWNKIWKYSAFFMFLIFLLSPIREELYPWYFLWVFPFVVLWKNKFAVNLSIAFSFGLLFYYVPYMYTGHYLLIPKYLFVGTATFFLLGVIFLLNKKSYLRSL